MPIATSLPRSGAALDTLNRQLEELSLEDFLRWSADTFGDRLVQVTSFGPTGMVILDHLLRVAPAARIVTIDTQFLFPETYAVWEEVERHYGIRVEAFGSQLSPQAQEEIYGPRLWDLEPDACCYERKVRPLEAALAGQAAWITGLRRDQSSTRAQVPLLSWDLRNNLFKLSPLAGWTRDEVWSYIRANRVPYNRLHDQGYASIGCTHCTRPVSNGAQERAGRWAGKMKTECGLHWQLVPQSRPGGCAV